MNFNISKDPWVPVISGSVQETLSLYDLFERSEKISTITGSSVERFSIMRLLICVTQAAIKGPKDDEDWKTCKDRIIPAVLKYLRDWSDNFELYGEHPFLQAPTLDKLLNRETSFLNPFFSSGGNHTLFDMDARRRDKEGKSVPRKISVDQIVRYLLCKQIFCPGGVTDRSTDGTKWGGGAIKEVSYEGSIATNTLLTLIEGDTLLDTIYHNLINEDWLKEAKIPFGRPVWEVSITQQSDSTKYNNTYLYNLVPLSRSILLHDENIMSMSNGFPPCAFPVYRDPMGTMLSLKKGNKTEEVYLKVSPEKAPWRDLQSLLQVSKGTSTQKGPWMLRRIIGGNDQDVIIVTGGFLYNQAKPVACCEWKLRIPSGLLNDSAINCYGALIEWAEKVAGNIRYAVEYYLHMEDKKLRFKNKENKRVYQSMLSIAMRRYWHGLEECAFRLIQGMASDINQAQDIWKQDVRNFAVCAFKDACGSYIKRDIALYVKSLQILKKELNNG